MAITRDQAYEILHKYMEGERYLEHSYAVEAIMRGVAEKLAPEEVEYWGVVGLLHSVCGAGIRSDEWISESHRSDLSGQKDCQCQTQICAETVPGAPVCSRSQPGLYGSNRIYGNGF